MPDGLGGKSLQSVATMIAYYGAWRSSLNILSERFPELVKDLDTTPMDKMPLSIEVRRRERKSAKATSTKREASVA